MIRIANCEKCGKKLPFLAGLTGQKLCEVCKIEIEQEKLKLEQELVQIEQEIIATKEITDKQRGVLEKLSKNSLISVYSNIYNNFIDDKELEEAEIRTLQTLQDTSGLTNEDIKFDDRIKPYLYVYTIKKEGKLPSPELQVEGGQLILKKGETVHFADKAILKEIRTINLGYSGGSRGVSFRIAKGISYRVGSHKGQILKEDRLVDTSKGNLLITNKRLFLQPFPGNKPLSIPLTKILSYHCYDNGLEVYKEGREKGYFLSIDKSGSVEIFGICLGFLLTEGGD